MKRARSISPVPEPAIPGKLSRSAPTSRSSSPALSLRPDTPPVTEQNKICLCHVHTHETKQFKTFTGTTWRTFKERALVRQDSIAKRMESKWDEGPINGYHLRCYQTYTTLKKNLPTEGDSEPKPGPSGTPDIEIKVESKILRRSGISGMQKAPVPSPSKQKMKPCIVCGCSGRKRFWKGKNRVWDLLSPCLTNDASDKLKTAAKKVGNFLMLAELESAADAMAGDITYHRTCYHNFVHGAKSGDSIHVTENVDPHQSALDKFCEEFNEDVIKGLNVRYMADMTSRYIEILSENGVSSPKYRTAKLKKKLIKRFGSSIEFGQPTTKHQSEFVFAATISKSEIVQAWMTTQDQQLQVQEAETGKEKDYKSPESNLFHTAKTLRMQLQTKEHMMPSLPLAEDVCEANISLPNDTFNFLAWMLTDSDEVNPGGCVKLNDKDRRLVMSFAQDLFYAANRQQIPTPKHLGIAHTVRNMTGSAELVTLLSRMGHSVSYPSLIRHECQLKQLHNSGNCIQLPLNIEKGTYISFVWDNNDLEEETLSGSDTTHHTNGIVLQKQVTGSTLPPGMDTQQTEEDQTPLANVIIPYYEGPRKGPPSAFKLPVDIDPWNYSPGVYNAAVKKDLIWCLLRMEFRQNTLFDFDNSTDSIHQPIPGWSPHNHNLRKDNIPKKTTVGYCQIIEDTPTKLSTVYTAMKRSQHMAKEAGQAELDITLDQAIYIKALDIQWSRGDEFANTVLRLGPFHTCCVFMNVIGKRFQDAGLADVLVECKVVAGKSIPSVMNGHQYNRAIRSHKIMREACERLRWQAFGKWMMDRNEPLDLVLLYNKISEARTTANPERVKELMELPEIDALFDLYRSFCILPRGPMDELWDSYIDMAEILLCFVHGIREGDLKLQVHAGVLMLKWMRAYDASHYSRCFPVHLLTMMNIVNSHPVVYDQLVNQGQMSVQRSDSNAFGMVAEDMSIEQTMNKASKAPGGIIGFSLKKSAVDRWVSTAPERMAITDNMKKMAGLTDESENVHKEATKSRVSKDEFAVRAIVNKLTNEAINPFESESDEIVSLMSGVVASKKVENDLLQAEKIGLQKSKDFVQNRLLSLEQGFHDKLEKCSLSTFTTLTTTKEKKTDQKNVIIKADRGIFARLMVVGQRRKIEYDELLEYELGPVPWSIATVFGTPNKTTKATMLKALDVTGPKCPTISRHPQEYGSAVDFMALIQTQRNPETFGNLAKNVLETVTSIKAKRIDLVCDRYPEHSIKNFERESRASTGVLTTKIVSPDQTIQQWSKFLKHGPNKESLVTFLYEEWQKPKYAPLIANHNLMVTHKDECHSLTQVRGKVRTILVPHLCTSAHEEADTRLFLHVKDLATQYDTVIIRTDDTDVITCALYFQWKVECNIVIERHAGGKSQLVDIKALSQKLGRHVCEALPGYHALTGCDSTSAFASRGKNAGLDIIRNNPDMCASLSLLGNKDKVDKDLQAKMETFVCRLYGYDCDNINDVRVDMFTAPMSKNKAPPESQNLPPTSDALSYHIKRANYQALIWKQSFEAEPELPEKTDCGWDVNNMNGKLEIHWMDNDPAPVSVLELISCGCKTDCHTKRCCCNKAGLPCTDACNCPDECVNVKQEAQSDEDESSESESEADDSDDNTSDSETDSD